MDRKVYALMILSNILCLCIACFLIYIKEYWFVILPVLCLHIYPHKDNDEE